MSEAVLVVTSLGDPGEPARVLANRGAAQPGELVTLADLEACRTQPLSREGGCMSEEALRRAELVVRMIAQTAVDNETYFCELDAVVGDGDFGYSLARGFEVVLERLGRAGVQRRRRPAEEDRDRPDQADRRHVRADLGDGVPARRRGARRTSPSRPARRSIAALRAAIEGIKQRGQHRPRRQDAARRARPGRRRARGRAAAEGARRGARAGGGQGARERRGDEGHARAARPGVVHRRAQPRLGGRGRDRHRRDVRGREQGLAGGGAGNGRRAAVREAHNDHEEAGEEVRQRPAAVRARDAQGHRARQPGQAASTSRSTT